jgi:RHS repeat-associated protein
MGLFWAALFLGSLPVQLEARKEQYRTVLTGTAINGGTTTLTAKDGLFPNPVYNASWAANAGIAFQQASNYILLRLDPDNLDFPGCNFTAKVTFTLQYLNANNIPTTIPNVSLSIEYNNDRGVIHKDQDFFTFTGGHWVQITNINVTVFPASGTCNNAVKKIRLENGINLERYYNFNATAKGNFTTCPPALNSANELELKWDPIPGAEEYHLEWLFINNYDVNNNGVPTPRPSASLKFNFRYNATRIETRNTSYAIPLIFEQGYVVFRYRAVGRGGANFDIPIAGAWTIPGEEKTDPAAFCHYYVDGTKVHEGDLKNWQLVTSYAEEGKQKAVVSYFGGDLRNRQSVTKINTDEQAIVGETIYDHQGRPAVEVMPTPAFDPRIKYYELYNRPSSDNTRAYNKQDFDLDKPGAICTPEAAPMNALKATSGSSGSARYYSPQNPDKTGHQAYVPDAELFPFAQVEYTPDNTGRIRRQGGVGPKYQLGKKFETRYYYGKPAKEHLNRLFGLEVGYNTHYKKNMVVDANSQVSVSYLDAQGRVIATALAGDSPINLLALESNKQKNPDPMVIDLLDNKPHFPGEPVLQSTFTHLVTSAGDHEFNYGISAEQYQPECLDNVCYDCVYDLVISVKDECGAEMIPGGAKRVTVGPFDANKEIDLDLSCIAVGGKESFTTYLGIGNYFITKTLTVNENALQFYLDDYLSQEECVKPLDEFIQEEFLNVNFDECDPPDCATSCLEKLGPNATAVDLQNCLLNCESPDPCQAAYEAMLHDFFPGGQYAEIEMVPGSANPPEFKAKDNTSIFHPKPNIFQITYNDPNIDYRDAVGNPAKVTLPDGSVLSPHQLSVSQFVHFFEESWAEALVQVHPEYCMYVACSFFNKDSEDFDKLMRNTDTYQEALALGLLNPLNLPFSGGIGFGEAPVNPQTGKTDPFDPFFKPGGVFKGDVNEMKLYVTQYPVPQGGSNLTTNLWYLAAAMAICKAPDAPSGCSGAVIAGGLVTFDPFSAADPDCFQDKIWENFRALYLAKKMEMVEKRRFLLYADNPNSPNCQKTILPGKIDHFPFLYMNMQTTLSIPDLFTNPAQISNNASSLSQTLVEQACQSQCESYASAWMQKLQGCNPTGTAWDKTNAVYNDLLKKLIEVCRAGCDEAHPMGSSTLPAGTGVPSIVPGEPDYQSFEDVIKSVMGHYGGAVSIACNADLLNMPMSYEYTYVSLTAGSNLDECACNEVLTRQGEYDAVVSALGNYPGNLSFAQYIQKVKGVELKSPERLACVCEKAYLKGSGGKAWTPGNPQWTQPALDYLETSGEYVPVELLCTDCVDCNKMKTEYNAYIQKIKADYYGGGAIPNADMSLVNRMLETHLNNTFGLDLSIWEFLDFIKECDTANATGFSCSEVTIEALDLGRLLNELVNPATTGINGGKSELLSQACLCLPPYGHPPTDPNAPVDPRNLNSPAYLYHQTPPYTNSLISHVDPAYSPAINNCDHLYNLKGIIGGVLTGVISSPGNKKLECPIELSFVSPGFDFAHIQQFLFQTIRIDPAKTSAGWNYHFLIDARVVVGNTLITTTLKGSTTCFPIAECAKGQDGISLCAPQKVASQLPDPCRDQLTNIAFQNAQNAYQEYIDEVRATFRAAYIDKCLKAAESFSMAYDDNEYHYTLYYYDQGGNLIKTIPPEGVELLTSKDCVDEVNASRDAGEQDIFTKHRMESRYRYNSLNQLTDQHMPDHDDFNDWGLKTVNIPSILDIQAISFSNDLEGVFIAIDPSTTPHTGVFYRTADGGDTWQPLAPGSVTPGTLRAVQFTDANTGYAVGSKGALVKTSNQGATWSIIHTTAFNDLVDLHFTSNSAGMVFDEKGQIFKTSDGGTNWSKGTTIPIDQLKDLNFLANNQLGFAVGEIGGKGAIFRTLDGGNTWAQQSAIAELDLNDVQFAGIDEGIAVGQEGTLLYTIDGGLNWWDIPTGLTADLVKIQFVNSGGKVKGYVLDNAGNVYLNDDLLNGKGWGSKPKLSGMADIFLLQSSLACYALASNGEVKKDLVFSGSFIPFFSASGATGMRSLFFVSDKEGYMAGDAKKIYKYEGGISWKAFDSPQPTANILKISSKGGNAVILTSERVYYCANTNQANWGWTNPETDPEFVDFDFYGKDGYLLASNGAVKKTTDSGATWTSIKAAPAASAIAIRGALGPAVVVGIKGSIAREKQGNWETPSKIDIPPLNRVHVVNATVAYAVGNGGTILHTINANDANKPYSLWAMEASGTGVNLNAVRFKDADFGFAGGDGGVMRYRDLTKWVSSSTPGNTSNILDIALNSTATNGYATTDDKILGLISNANSWVQVETTNVPLYGIHAFPGGTNQFHAVGVNGAIWFRSSASSKWTNQTFNTRTEPLYDLQMKGATGYAVGTGGLMFTSADKGLSWTPLPTGIKKDLFGLYFSNAAKGVIVGKGGTLIHTDNGGLTWNKAVVSGNVTADLHDVDFNDDGTRGYVVGDNATLLSSTNYTNWSPAPYPAGASGSHFRAVDLQDITGYVVGTNGVILKSENCSNPATGWSLLQADNGERWPLFATGANADLRDLHFIDRRTGYVVGAKGLLLKTIDGGASFEARPSLTTQQVNTLSFSSSTNGLFAGDDGYMTRLQDGTDRFSTRFWYDQFGRLKASQNARQFAQKPKRYSYSRYDELGRVVEAGEVAFNTPPDQFIYAPNFPENWVAGQQRYQVTLTLYDGPNPAPLIQQQFGAVGQENLRGRVSSVLYYDVYAGGGSLNYRFASHYSYDIHGNVYRLVQENRDLEVFPGQQFKSLGYTYDLVSGNVNEVHYQDGQCDAFYHRYHYDADNRIDTVWTSADGLQWDRDAEYTYYDHGPLARTELGDQKVQGVDYAYNLQGWIKGANSNVLNPKFDIGKDGFSAGVARDVYGYSLGYYTSDYKAIEAANNMPGNSFYANPTAAFGAAAKDLHNGNIRHMVTSLSDEKGNLLAPQGTAYQYDQLNRIKSMDAFSSASVLTNNNFNGVTNPSGAYHEEYTYDANGNILTLLRNGIASKPQMDNLAYKYETHGGKKVNNRLLHVNDAPAYTGNYPNAGAPNTFDIDDQGIYDPSDPGAWNYDYDETGNLVRDAQEHIDLIEWTVYGKVKRIVRSTANHNMPDLEFAYDPMGNRIVKLVKPRVAGLLQKQEYWTYTYYVRDAQGTIMAVYERDYRYIPATKLVEDKLRLAENHLYGSNRLGIENRDVQVAGRSFVIAGHFLNGIFLGPYTSMTYLACAPTPSPPARLVGKKQYELSNHLGNVLSTITDRRLELKAGPSLTVSGYVADVSSYSDYYPFGMEMPGRGYVGGGFRFGFQGQEGDDEVGGEGNSFYYKYRMHDPRVGRFFSIDPLGLQFPWNSPYSFSENRVIDGIDLEGTEFFGCTSTAYIKGGLYIGAGYGINLEIKVGNAVDMVGVTQFVLATALAPWNQDLRSGTQNPQFILGGEASVDFGVDITRKPTFAQAENVGGIQSGGADFHFVPGGGGEIGFAENGMPNKLGVNFGLGWGGGATIGDHDFILNAISITSSEWFKVKDLSWVDYIFALTAPVSVVLSSSDIWLLGKSTFREIEGVNYEIREILVTNPLRGKFNEPTGVHVSREYTADESQRSNHWKSMDYREGEEEVESESSTGQ